MRPSEKYLEQFNKIQERLKYLHLMKAEAKTDMARQEIAKTIYCLDEKLSMVNNQFQAEHILERSISYVG